MNADDNPSVDEPKSAGLPPEGLATTHPVVIDRERVPGAIYANAMQAVVSTNELFLSFGLASPPLGPLPENAAVEAEFVARIVFPVSLLNDIIRQLENAQNTYNAMRAILDAQNRAEQ